MMLMLMLLGLVQGQVEDAGRVGELGAVVVRRSRVPGAVVCGIGMAAVAGDGRRAAQGGVVRLEEKEWKEKLKSGSVFG